MGVTRKYYSDQFKEEAVKLAESVGISRAAKDLGIHTTNLRRWKLQPDQGISSPSLTDKDKEILKLKKELRYVYQINEVLKKSLGIFVKDPGKNSL